MATVQLLPSLNVRRGDRRGRCAELVKAKQRIVDNSSTCSPRSESARFPRGEHRQPARQQTADRPDSGITGVSRPELNLRRPHRSAVVVDWSKSVSTSPCRRAS